MSRHCQEHSFMHKGSMQIHLSPRHLKLTGPIHHHASGIIVELEDMADIIAAHVVLVHDDAAKPKDRYCAKVHLALAGTDIFGEANGENIHTALDLVAGTLAQQLRKRKSSTIDKPRRKAQRAIEKDKKG